MPRRPTATERIYEMLKSQISDGSLPGGVLVTEGAVAEQGDVSRTPVREAFLRLEAEGLLQLFPRQGALVVPVTAVELSEVVEARFLIERWALSRLVEAPSAAVLVALRDAVAEQRAAIDADDADAFYERDRAFHEQLVAGAQNSLLRQFYGSLRDRQMRMGIRRGVLSQVLPSGDAAKLLTDHIEIIAALEQGELAPARLVIDRHEALIAKLLTGHR
jgi:DNA-binding GntR family transcriptional regulator